MYIQGPQLPREATAKLKKAGYDRRAEEEVAHKVNGDSVVVTFVTAAFHGGISSQTVSLAEFRRNFAVIRRAKR